MTIEVIRSAVFRSLGSRDGRIAHFPRPPYQCSFQLIADVFRVPKSAAWVIDERLEREVRDFGSILHQARTGQERFFSQDWWRGFR
jgi:hypothetical protein